MRTRGRTPSKAGYMKCAECGHNQVVSAAERSRRSRPRCTRCGSHYLDPVPLELVCSDKTNKTK